MLAHDKNPLPWWKVKAELLPELACLARRYLSIPATSASSERVFSVAGRIVRKDRHRLKDDRIAQLVLLKGQ